MSLATDTELGLRVPGSTLPLTGSDGHFPSFGASM